MAAVSTPVFIQAGSHPAADVRRAFQGLLGGRGGVMHPSHLKVSQNGTPNMSVNVAEGFLALPGTESTTQGYYLVEGRGVTNVTLAAATTSPRIDLIVATIRDAAYATGPTNDFRIIAVSGTPAPSPVAPAAPANSWVLATVAVGASVTSITDADITDTRFGAGGYTAQLGYAAPAGLRVVCTSGTRPTSPWAGMEIYETDTNKAWVYNGSLWVPPGPLGLLAQVTRTTDTASFGATTYFDSVTANNVLPNRNLLVEIHTNVYAFTAGITVSLSVCSSAGTILNQSYDYFQTASVTQQMVCRLHAASGAGGSLTYKIGAFTSAGTAKLQAGGTSVTYISITDVGPV